LKTKTNIEKPIPIIKAEELNDFHYNNIDWQPTISEAKHQYYHINRIEDYVKFLKFPLPPHRKTVHDLIFLNKGNSIRRKGLNKFEFSASEVFFLPALQLTEHQSMSLDSEGFYLHFDEKIFHFLPKNFLNDTYHFFQIQANPIITLSAETCGNINVIFERLLFLYQDQRESEINLIAAYILALFEEIKKDLPLVKKITKNAYSQVTEQYKNALANHIYQKQSITDYAHILNISPNYLNKCVKNSINKTAQDLLNEMLILEAKTLLKFSNLQIAEIAVKLCDQTPSNFSRFFKNQTGISPKEFLELN
jgi:AraC family transcriptional regulator, transcriptional activator of pobA